MSQTESCHDLSSLILFTTYVGTLPLIAMRSVARLERLIGGWWLDLDPLMHIE